MVDKKTLWNSGSLAGLALGAVSVAYILIGMLHTPAVLAFILWGVKFAACIYLMSFFMKRFARQNSSATNSDTFRFGVVTALCSALVYSTFYLVYVSYIAPETFSMAFNTVMESYSSMMDYNSLQALEQIEPKMPRISFFVNLIYCFLFGTVLSAIMSRSIPSSDPFKN